MSGVPEAGLGFMKENFISHLNCHLSVKVK
jgi:hypothetical protein